MSRKLPFLRSTTLPRSPGNGSAEAGFGRRRYDSAFWASLAYTWLPVRSLSRVHSSTRVPMVASPLEDEPDLRIGFGFSVLSGMPVGVSKATLSMSARWVALVRIRSMSARFADGMSSARGPLRRS